jgi:hypothetical protein
MVVERGFCEICKNYDDNLRLMDGKMRCRNCQEREIERGYGSLEDIYRNDFAVLEENPVHRQRKTEKK